LIFIEADNPDIGLMCVMPVGMAEVSSCEITVYERQKIMKGDQLGSFHFGGSTHCLFFGPHVKLDFDLHGQTPGLNSTNIPVNARIATVQGYWSPIYDSLFRMNSIFVHSFGTICFLNIGEKMLKIFLGLLCGVSLFAADIEVTSYDNVKNMIKNSSKYSIVVLGNDHCPFCKITMESVKKLDQKYNAKAQFFYINLDQNEEARSDYSVHATPNLLFFTPEGKLIEQKIGGLNEIGFAKKLDTFKW
jgi:thiol-disulfide isomerase/thioredoxin